MCQCEDLKWLSVRFLCSAGSTLNRLTSCAHKGCVPLSDHICVLKVKFCVFAVLKSTQLHASQVTSLGHWFLQVTFVTDCEIDFAVLALLVCVCLCACVHVLAVIETKWK